MDQAQLAQYAEQRDPIERLAARLRLDGLGDDEIEALRSAAADEVSAGLAAAEASPAPDPATILDGVYASELT
jgi:pyruvate dehydrogenase E1 component alpha subunit